MATFETTSCPRCGGSGSYSYNSLDGSRCYGCGGSGKVHTPRGAAASAEFARLTTVKASEVRAGWLIYASSGSGLGRNRWQTVQGVEAGTMSPGGLELRLPGYSWGLGPDTPVRAVPSKDAHAAALAKALAFQTAWSPAE